MVAAKQGYRFREREREFDFRYGFSPIPAERTLEPAPKERRDAISGRDKGGLLLLLIFAGLVGIGMIAVSAWTTSIQYDINRIVAATEATYEDIERLAVKIEKGTGISVIEQKAIDELGMIYPAAEQIVYLEDEPPPMNDFAQYIKENTYQLW
jgi:cell division protein FtsL